MSNEVYFLFDANKVKLEYFAGEPAEVVCKLREMKDGGMVVDARVIICVHHKHEVSAGLASVWLSEADEQDRRDRGDEEAEDELKKLKKLEMALSRLEKIKEIIAENKEG